jgi:hypothetical protein
MIGIMLSKPISVILVMMALWRVTVESFGSLPGNKTASKTSQIHMYIPKKPPEVAPSCPIVDRPLWDHHEDGLQGLMMALESRRHWYIPLSTLSISLWLRFQLGMYK